VLGCLDQAPSHGYDLLRHFNEGGDLAGVVRFEQPTLYATLKELAGRGLIAGHEEREGLRPPRTVYALTPAGNDQLDRWLEAPVQRLREVRLDFLLKVYFTRKRRPASVRDLVDRQIAVCHRYLSDLEGRAAGAAPESFPYLVTQSKLSAARATLAWLQEYRRQLKGDSAS
jgi:DNA-binding PadR family transcriptional regulator